MTRGREASLPDRCTERKEPQAQVLTGFGFVMLCDRGADLAN